MSVIFLGYDPGGHKRHGVAYIDDNNTSVCATVESAEASVLWFMERCPGFEHVVMGVGTLTLWSTCAESWRPADRQLRESYPQLAQLVQSPNNLRGAMIINGALVMRILSENVTSLRITETHPRLLYNVLSGQIYHYQGNTAIEMSDRLQEWIGVNGIELHYKVGILGSSENSDVYHANISALA